MDCKAKLVEDNNIIIDQRFQIQKLEAENKALKDKMTLMYKNWLYDSQRYRKPNCETNFSLEQKIKYSSDLNHIS